MPRTTTHWPSILTLLVVIPGVGLFLAAAVGFGISSILSLAAGGMDPAGTMIGAFAAGVEGLILAVAAGLILQKTLGRPNADIPITLSFSTWQIMIAGAVTGVALLIGGLVSFSGITWLGVLVLPLLTVLVIAPPIWVLLGLGTRGIELGPRWRTWSIFGLGMTLGPLVMLVLEFVLILFVVIAGSLYAVFTPDLVNEIMQLAPAVGNETNPEAIIELLAPYIINRSVITLAFVFFSLAIPLIEEAFKPLGVWLFARQIQTPAQGFALGLLSGAAYALVESLGVSGQSDSSWALVVSIRAGTSLLHITTSGLMGWAIVKAWQERKIPNLLLTYLAVVLIHGLWNGSVVGAGISSLSDMVNETNFTFTIIPAMVCGISTLVAGMLAILLAANRRVRKTSPEEADQAGNTGEQTRPDPQSGVK